MGRSGREIKPHSSAGNEKERERERHEATVPSIFFVSYVVTTSHGPFISPVIVNWDRMAPDRQTGQFERTVQPNGLLLGNKSNNYVHARLDFKIYFTI